MRHVPWVARVAEALALVFVLPGLGGAQEPVTSFDQLNTRLKPGDKVWVTDSQGREITGRVDDVRSVSLALREGRTFRGEEVRQVARQKGDRTRIGALYGAGIGAVLGAWSGHREYEREVAPYCHGPCDSGGYMLGFGAVLGAVGACVGALVGNQIPAGRLVVYRQPGSTSVGSSRLSVTPVITPRTKGVAVAFVF
jgi:hypothetical protein